MQKFVIITSGRSGSYHLVDLLSSHKNIVCFGELFNKRGIGFWDEKLNSSEEILLFRNKNPIKFLNKVILRDYPKEKEIFGFKLLYSQIQKPILKYLKKKKWKVIHLKRRNLLKQFISNKKAIVMNKWSDYNNDDIQIYNKIKINVNSTQFLKKCKSILKSQKKIDKIFKSNQLMEVFYENLCIDSETEMRKIQEFLEVKYKKLKPKQKKINKVKISETILNYTELKKQFIKTKYNIFFED